MPILRSGNKIRMNGDDVRVYREETGRSKLPTTVAEYNKALHETIEYWLSANCNEGELLAGILTEKLIGD